MVADEPPTTASWATLHACGRPTRRLPVSSAGHPRATSRGGRGPIVATVEPAPYGDGWHVLDPTDPEPTWRATLGAAVDEAIALAAAVLAERIGRELSRSEPGVAERGVSGAADMC